MSAHGKISALTSQSSLLACALTAFLAGASPLAAAPTAPAPSVTLNAGETWRGAGGAPGEVNTFSIRLDAPGILLVDVDAPVAAPAVRLVLLPQTSGGTGFELLRQSATSLALAASPGDYRLRVAAEDPRQPLSAVRLRTRFTDAPFAKSETGTEIEIDPDPRQSETGTEIEIDPDPRKSETGTEIEIDPDPRKSERGTEIEIDPDPRKSETGTEIEIDPDPTIVPVDPQGGASRLLGRRLGKLCRQGEVDDHGDTLSCSTPLAPGIAARGALGNGYGDDSDVFRFEVTALAPVELRARAPFALAGELYDRQGQRLDTAISQGAGGLRLVRTLVPGTYFLRLEGREGAEGDYTVAVRQPLRQR